MAARVLCDGCGAIGDVDRDPGWVRWHPLSRVYRTGVDDPEPKDYCPICAERMQATLRPSITQQLQQLQHPVLGGGVTLAEADAALTPLRDYLAEH